MKKVIWKFPLRLQDQQIVYMPMGAKILDVQLQHDTIMLWALCNVDMDPINGPQHNMEARGISIHGTGHELASFGPAGEYLGTVQRGGFVWHVFEEV